MAYLSDVAGETQIFIMNPDGSQKKQVTSSIPVKTIDKDKVGYSWSEDGTYIIYPHLNKLYKTTIEGGGKLLSMTPSQVDILWMWKKVMMVGLS